MNLQASMMRLPQTTICRNAGTVRSLLLSFRSQLQNWLDQAMRTGGNATVPAIDLANLFSAIQSVLLQVVDVPAVMAPAAVTALPGQAVCTDAARIRRDMNAFLQQVVPVVVAVIGNNPVGEIRGRTGQFSQQMLMAWLMLVDDALTGLGSPGQMIAPVQMISPIGL